MADSGAQQGWRDMSVLALLLLFILAIRLVLVVISPAELYADEAQYWRWSREFDWGYYSKPPLIAWTIGVSTALFGNAEWGVRILAPVLHTIAAFALFLLGRAMYGARTGLLAALVYILMPGVTLSASIISTDGVLLPIWCLALWLLWRLRGGEIGWLGVAVLGIAMGAGLLAKYAMVYFFIGLALTTLLDRDTRLAVLAPKGLVALVLAGLVMAPHFIWNAVNDFATVGHTVDNANLGGDLLNPEHLLEFLLDQMGVFGPIAFLALIGGLIVYIVRKPAAERDGRDLWLIAFILPVIIFIAGQAVLSRAHANWAATAYPAASVLVAAWLLRAQPRALLWIAIATLTGAGFVFATDLAPLLRGLLAGGFMLALLGIGAVSKWHPVGLLWTGIGLNAVLAALFMLAPLTPPGLSAQLGVDNALKRVRGWDAAAQQVLERAEAMQASAILVDEREVWHGLDYYMRHQDHPPLIAWRRNPSPKSFSETRPLSEDIDDTVLVVSFRPQYRPRMRGDFAMFETIGEIEIPLGERANGCPLSRRFVLYAASDFDEKPRNAAWEERYRDLSERPNPPCP